MKKQSLVIIIQGSSYRICVKTLYPFFSFRYRFKCLILNLDVCRTNVLLSRIPPEDGELVIILHEVLLL